MESAWAPAALGRATTFALFHALAEDGGCEIVELLVALLFDVTAGV